MRTLIRWTDFGEADSDIAVRALAGAVGNPSVCERLLELLGDAAAETRIEILDAIGAGGDEFPGADRVWLMVTDPNLEIEVRTAAMRCLEHTGAADHDRIALELSSMPAPVRLHAARSLIAVGDREGLTELLRLGDKSADARRLLSKMSGIRIHHGMPAFRKWVDSLEPNEVPALPVR